MNSFGVRSAIVIKWRGAFVAGVEYDRVAVFERHLRVDEAIVGRIDGIMSVGQNEEGVKMCNHAFLIVLYNWRCRLSGVSR